MALSLTQVRASFERLKKDISDVSTDTFVEWNNFTARWLYRKIAGTDPERYIDADTTYTVSSDPQTSALPTDPAFRDITPEGCGFFLIDDDSKDTNRRLVRTGPGRRDIGYYISGSNVIFTGMEDSTQFRLRYIPELTTFDALADYWTINNASDGVEIIPEQYLENIVTAIDILYTRWDEEPGAESLADFRFVRALSEIIENIRKEPDSHQLSDFTLNYLPCELSTTTNRSYST